MIYPASSYLNLFFLFFGAALGSFFCILAGKIFKKKYFKFRLSLAFLLLSAAVIFAVLMVLEMGGNAKEIPSVLKTRILALCIYAVAGLLCAAFMRTFLPIAAAAYIAFTFWFGVQLYKAMPLPSTITVTVSQTFVRDETNGAEYKFGAERQDVLGNLAFDVYNLNDNILLPLPNTWYLLRGTSLDSAAQTPVFNPSAATNAFQKCFFEVCKKILGAPRTYEIPVPVQQIYPSLYNVKINAKGVKFGAVLEKII